MSAGVRVPEIKQILRGVLGCLLRLHAAGLPKEAAAGLCEAFVGVTSRVVETVHSVGGLKLVVELASGRRVRLMSNLSSSLSPEDAAGLLALAAREAERDAAPVFVVGGRARAARRRRHASQCVHCAHMSVASARAAWGAAAAALGAALPGAGAGPDDFPDAGPAS